MPGRLSAPINPAIASGPSLTTLAHAHPFADFNLHNRHSRKNQLLRRNLGSTLTATGAPPPAAWRGRPDQSSRGIHASPSASSVERLQHAGFLEIAAFAAQSGLDTR